jgi:hypothetical protein
MAAKTDFLPRTAVYLEKPPISPLVKEKPSLDVCGKDNEVKPNLTRANELHYRLGDWSRLHATELKI